MPLLSVVVNLYNEERLLPRCVESIMSQDFEDWELVLVDDGSQDSSAALCDAYAAQDARIRVVHQQNKGFSGSRNTGIALARGTYVMFVDADDWIEPGTFAEAADEIQRYGQPDLVIGGLNWSIYDGDERIECSPVAPPEDYAFETKDMDTAVPYLLGLSPFAGPLHYCVWGRFYRKAVIDAYDLRFNENLFVQEDVTYIYTFLFYAKRCVASHKVFYNYCRPVGKDDLAEKPQINQYQCVEAALDVVIKTNFKYGFPRDYQMQIYRRTYDHYIKLSEKIFLESTGLSEDEQFAWMVRMTEGFGFRFFAKIFRNEDPFWHSLGDMLDVGDYRGIFNAWRKKIGEGVAPAGE